MCIKQALLAMATAALLLAAGTTVTTASTILMEPGGAIRAVSEGRVTLIETLEERIACNFTLEGTLARESIGTLSEAPEPATNPALGSIRGGRAAECTGGATVALLFGDGLWKWYGFARRGEIWSIYWLHVQYLIGTRSWACLYDQRWAINWNLSTGEITLEKQNLIVRTLRGICPIEAAGGGRMRSEPRQTGTLR